MKEYARGARAEGRVIGLVPTMGALHEGHTALVKRARQECSRVIASVFVNPKQFGPNEDYKKYPRDLEKDAEKLAAVGVDVLFAPATADVYPDRFRTYVNVEGISERLEGRSRPGHFRGVTTVVLKLFEIVQPRMAFFGRKDAQQARLIRQMTRDLELGTEIVVCPIVREPDGLALSSRNAYLSPSERRAATVLYRSLDGVRREISAGERDVVHLLAGVRRIIAAEPEVALDYAEIVDADTLDPARALRNACYVMLAARVGSTRLIDNALIEPEGESLNVTV